MPSKPKTHLQKQWKRFRVFFKLNSFRRDKVFQGLEVSGIGKLFFVPVDMPYKYVTAVHVFSGKAFIF